MVKKPTSKVNAAGIYTKPTMRKRLFEKNPSIHTYEEDLDNG